MSFSPPKYSAIQVARQFISFANNENIEITPMKLLKLVYIAQGVHLATHESPLFEEDILAWDYGPIVDVVFNQYKDYGNKAIYEPAGSQEIKNDLEVLKELKATWDYFKKWSAIQLSSWSQLQGSPWQVVWDNSEGQPLKVKVIPLEEIKAYFEREVIKVPQQVV